MMKRWLPFILLILTAIFFSVYFFLFDRINLYKPQTSNPAVIYREACADCHGAKGEGSGLFYPELQGIALTAKEIKQFVRNGALLMPSFPNIPDSVLQKLSEYISDEKYLK